MMRRKAGILAAFMLTVISVTTVFAVGPMDGGAAQGEVRHDMGMMDGAFQNNQEPQLNMNRETPAGESGQAFDPGFVPGNKTFSGEPAPTIDINSEVAGNGSLIIGSMQEKIREAMPDNQASLQATFSKS